MLGPDNCSDRTKTVPDRNQTDAILEYYPDGADILAARENPLHDAQRGGTDNGDLRFCGFMAGRKTNPWSVELEKEGTTAWLARIMA
jgi:hypothetical protein